MNAHEKLNMINADLAAGRTVYIQTCTRTLQISPVTAAKWLAAGKALFTVRGSSLFIASGRNYNCIDNCGITVE